MFIGKNKNFEVQAYSGAGRSGLLDHALKFYSTTQTAGLNKAYDPSTGLLTVDCTALTASITVNDIGVYTSAGADWSGGQNTGYFDVIVSESAAPMAIVAPNSEVVFDTGVSSNGSTNTTVSRFANATTAGNALTVTQSTTLGDSITVNEPGVYSMTWTAVASASASNYTSITINGTALTTDPSSITFAQGGRAWGYQSSDVFIFTSLTKQLVAGDVIRFQRSNTHLTTGSQNVAIVTQVSKQ